MTTDTSYSTAKALTGTIRIGGNTFPARDWLKAQGARWDAGPQDLDHRPAGRQPGHRQPPAGHRLPRDAVGACVMAWHDDDIALAVWAAYGGAGRSG